MLSLEVAPYLVAPGSQILVQNHDAVAGAADIGIWPAHPPGPDLVRVRSSHPGPVLDEWLLAAWLEWVDAPTEPSASISLLSFWDQ